MFRKIARGWEEMEFIVIPYRDTSDMFILGDVEEVMALLDDNQVTAQTMMESR